MPPDSLTAAINAVHQAMEDIGDPALVSTLGQCLNALTSVQQKLMGGQNPTAGGPTQGPPPGAAQQALLAQLQG